VVGAITALAPVGALSAAAIGGGAGAATTTAAAITIVHRPIDVADIRNDTVGSTNWSGYAVQSVAAFTDVVGTWAEPTSLCSRRSTTYGSFWVGLDGYSSNSVEQLGTDSDCANGSPSYYAWYEMYPANSVMLSSSSYPVRAGDTLTGEVSRSGGSYTLSLKSSRGWHFAITESGSDANSSAEWVAEAPEICGYFSCRLANLTDFGSMTFTGAAAGAGAADAPISSFTADGGPHDIVMVTNSGATKALPSALATGGGGFSDTWYHS